MNIFLTGASGKIGEIYLNELLSRGHNLIVTTRLDKNYKYLSEKYLKYCNSNKLTILKIELFTKKSIDILDESLQKLDFKIDAFIHAARNQSFLVTSKKGIQSRKNWIGELTLDVIVPYDIILMLLKDRKHPLIKVIIVSSIYGIVAPNLNVYNNYEVESPVNYSVAKAAQIHLVKTLATRLIKKGVQVNAISYGGVKGRASEEFVRRYAQYAPSKNMLTEEDIYDPLDFLLESTNLSIVGHNLVVDSGWTIW